MASSPKRVTALAGWLLDEGFVPGEATGICIRDEVNHLVASMAVLCMDTAQISLASHENATTRRALADRVGVSQLIVEAPEAWMEGLRTIEMPATGTEVLRGFRSGLPNAVCQGRAINSVAIYQNTSGSTNVPKTWPFRLIACSGCQRAMQVMKRSGGFCAPGPSNSTRIDCTASVCCWPATVPCFSRHLNLQNFVEFCAREEVTAVHMGGYKLALWFVRERKLGRLPAFTTIHTGGARVPGCLRKRLKCVLTDNLYVIYATSEIGLISCATPDQHESFPEGVGFPATSLTLEIIGADGGQVAPGEIGQIRVRKVGMFNDYVAAPGANANFQEGWFYPRDLVSLMPGEPLIFYGRADDVMILNGINIFPSAIEDVLESHPDVKEAVAYAVKSRVHGENSRGRRRFEGRRRAESGLRSPESLPAGSGHPRSTSDRCARSHTAERSRQAAAARAFRRLAKASRLRRRCFFADCDVSTILRVIGIC